MRNLYLSVTSSILLLNLRDRAADRQRPPLSINVRILMHQLVGHVTQILEMCHSDEVASHSTSTSVGTFLLYSDFSGVHSQNETCTALVKWLTNAYSKCLQDYTTHNNNLPTGENLAWSFPIPLTAIKCKCNSWPGRIFEINMSGCTGPMSASLWTEAWLPIGCHFIWDE